MPEFTGDYSNCNNCGHIYDYNDLCPECGSGDITDMSAKEIKREFIPGEVITMLESHDDL